MAMICHLLFFAGFIIPFGNVLGPLVLWLIKKDTMPFVDDQGKEVLNFQITLVIVGAICFITSFLILPLLVGLAVFIAAVVFAIIGTIKSNEGVAYRYPYILRLIK
ncbi:orotate phosphoribosyltransferase [Brevifollis gellanilyticus]|uniref:Orotate phosphoribosyltransferase n=2 Tax=Brevifollis gellanilyticus TaxID=748831 RepID=A0A512MFB9_9BACT|nr:orotate phosphoribosyltransferase [Brevifollis gellanilyticus]